MAKTNRIKNKQIKGAIDWLISSGLILKIPIVNTARIPFSAYTTENRFKLCLFDCGILGALSHLSQTYIRNQCRGEPCVRPPDNNRLRTYD